jgi:putative hydrolase of the HAD superfamily
MVASLREGFDPSEMETAPALAESLEQLRSSGLRIGIICDVGLTPSVTLRSYLDHHGLLQYFDHWSFSDEVGVYKPDGRIFAHAMEGLGITDPAAMAHIGDLRRTDVAGARAAGWRSLRYTGFSDDPTDLPEADDVVSDHSQLPGLLVA